MLKNLSTTYDSKSAKTPNGKPSPDIPTFIQAVPARTTMARAVMPRQPYSEAVPSTGGRFPSSSLRVSVPYKGNRRGRKDH